MGKTKLGLKEPFSCLNSKYHTWAIQINHLFSLFQPQTAKKLWIECQKHEILDIFGIKFAVIIPLILICSKLLQRIRNKKR